MEAGSERYLGQKLGVVEAAVGALGDHQQPPAEQPSLTSCSAAVASSLAVGRVSTGDQRLENQHLLVVLGG